MARRKTRGSKVSKSRRGRRTMNRSERRKVSRKGRRGRRTGGKSRTRNMMKRRNTKTAAPAGGSGEPPSPAVGTIADRAAPRHVDVARPGYSQAALREIARALATKAKPKARKSGISAARKRYTDARKTKLASLRAHRDKLVREHKAKTKKMPKKERDAARREFRKKVDSQYKEQVKKYPPARGMKDVGSVLKLIKRVQGARFS